MSTPMPSVIDTRNLLAQLMTEITQLTDELAAQRGVTALAYRLPVMSYAHRSVAIDVTPLAGREALSSCLAAYRQIYREENQDPVTSVRYPGVVFCASLPVARVERINALKDELSRLVSSLKGRPRATFMRQALPNISTHHLCRHIPMLKTPVPVTTIGFTWSGNTPLMRSLSYDQVIAFCARRAATGAIHPHDLERINLSTGQIYERRLMAPHPRMNIVCHDRQTGTPLATMLTASLPLLVEASAASVFVTPLSSYQEDDQRQPRSDRKPLRPLIPHLDLYEEIAS